MADESGSEKFWTPYLADTVLPRALPGYLGAPAGRRPAEPRKLDTALPAADSERIRRARPAGRPGRQHRAHRGLGAAAGPLRRGGRRGAGGHPVLPARPASPTPRR